MGEACCRQERRRSAHRRGWRPIGGPITWRVDDGGPLLVVADGSGLVPLIAMLRHRTARSSAVGARLLISTGSPAEVLYRSELMRLAAGDGLAVHRTVTHDLPAACRGFARRLDTDMLKAIGPAPARRPRIFICGPTAFVGRAAHLLVQLGHEPERIRVEDFGPMQARSTSKPSADDSTSSRRGPCARLELRRCLIGAPYRAIG